MKLLIASNNAGKVREIKAMLGPFYPEIYTPRDIGLDLDVVEDGQTFEDNARLKARAFAQASGMDALADDSGLCVDALNGAPGVYSARFAGEHGDDSANNALLLEKLKGVPDAERTARFVSCVVLCMQNGDELVAQAASEGRILHQAVGQGGFGYDPLFFDEHYQKSYAQLTEEQKNAISHRGKALALLQSKLEDRV